MEKIIKPFFTAFVVAMIVLPLPPSTIIGLALVANPVTSKYVDPRALRALAITGFAFKSFAIHLMDAEGIRDAEHFVKEDDKVIII